MNACHMLCTLHLIFFVRLGSSDEIWLNMRTKSSQFHRGGGGTGFVLEGSNEVDSRNVLKISHH